MIKAWHDKSMHIAPTLVVLSPSPQHNLVKVPGETKKCAVNRERVYLRRRNWNEKSSSRGTRSNGIANPFLF